MYTGNKFIPQVVPERFSKVTRDEILNHILEYGPNPSVIFKETGADTEDVQLVINEIERLEQEVLSKVKGTFVITPATYDEEGIELTPAVYFTGTTKLSVQSTLDNSYVSPIVWLDIFIQYYPDYNPTRTWIQFKNAVQAS